MEILKRFSNYLISEPIYLDPEEKKALEVDLERLHHNDTEEYQREHMEENWKKKLEDQRERPWLPPLP